MKKYWLAITILVFALTMLIGNYKWNKEINSHSTKANDTDIKNKEDNEEDVLKIVLLGDSNTEISYFTENNKDKKWSNIIESKLDAEVINLGKDGRRTSDFLKSGSVEDGEDKRVGEFWRKKYKDADYFLITFGLNDAKDYSAEKFEEYTREMIEVIKEETQGEPVLMTNVYVPFPEYHSWDRNKEINEYDDIKRKLSKELDINLIDVNERFKSEWLTNGLWDTRIRNNDLWDAAEDEGKNPNSKWFDNIHYNENGNKIVSEEVIKFFNKLSE